MSLEVVSYIDSDSWLDPLAKFVISARNYVSIIRSLSSRTDGTILKRRSRWEFWHQELSSNFLEDGDPPPWTRGLATHYPHAISVASEPLPTWPPTFPRCLSCFSLSVSPEMLDRPWPLLHEERERERDFGWGRERQAGQERMNGGRQILIVKSRGKHKIGERERD